MIGTPITVGTTATAIVPEGTAERGQGEVAYPMSGIIRIPTAASNTVWFGGINVTVNNGCPFVAGEDLEIDLVNEVLYAVASTTQTIYLLRRGY